MIRFVSALPVAGQALLTATYAFAALALAAVVFLLLPAGGLLLAVAFGLAVFFGCGVGHLGLLILGVRRTTVGEVDALRDAYGEVRRELKQARDEARAILTAVESTTRSRQGQSMELGEVMAEVKVLQSLVERVSVRGGAPVQMLQSGQAEPAMRLVASGGHAAGAQGGRAVASPVEPMRGDGLAPVPPDSTQASDELILDHVREGLRANRIDLYLQPVVSLPQRKRRHLEVFSRIRTEAGAILLPQQYMGIAAREGLISAIDNMLLFRSVQLARRLQHSQSRIASIYVNISEHTLADATFFRDFAGFMAENRDLAQSIIFEFVQSHVGRLAGAVMLELERLARLGFRFSMDQVTDLRLDPDDLGRRHFRTVKIEAARLLDAVRREDNALDIRALKAALDRNNIDLIVEKIETEATLVEILDMPVDFGQGYLFGEPRPMRE